ncbi:MAG: aromatic amino acid lyase, partial [Candidatus Obscuribacterales bacterium]|nr:aromatic amino acid lyase [Candidatus Obscuribacterales bacterium]
EDHVSMGTIGSRKARDILENTTKVLAIELLCATQGLDFRLKNNTDTSHKIESLSPGPGLQAAYDFVRSKITHLDEDREIHLDMDAAEQIVAGGEFLKAVEVSLGPLQ